MKKRTRVFAWIFAIGASLGIVRFGSSVVTLLIERPKSEFYGEALGWEFLFLMGNLLLLIGWLDLLDRRVWAWWLLVSVSGLIGAAFGAGAVVASFLFKGHVAATVSLFVFPCILPLLVLLSDRPSGWSQAADPQSEIPSSQ